jgi:hypothetical protein
VRLWWFWFDTGYACGALVVDAKGVVVDSAPIYRRRFVGHRFRDIERQGRAVLLTRDTP